MKLTLVITLVLIVLTCNLAAAYPPIYSIDRIDGDVADYREARDLDDISRNVRPRRLYFVDEDYYYPQRSSAQYPYVPNRTPIRREDTNIDKEFKYTPLVRYKSTHTKRKKLFVPNLWG